MAGLTFESRRPGRWERDLTHMPHAVTPMFAELWPQSFEEGFAESFERYGIPLHCIGMQVVNGTVYMAPVPLDGAPGWPEDGDLASALAACADRARHAFENRIWREQLTDWFERVKPASLAAHASLAGVDLPALSDDALALHIDACIEHHRAMVRQHHRFNGAAMLPVGDFVEHVVTWTGLPRADAMTVFEAHSPMSGVWSDEIAPAALAVRSSADARALLDAEGDAAKRLFELRQLLPEVDAYVKAVAYRVVDSFDVTAPTMGEMPTLVLGKLKAAAELGGPPSTERADERARALRDLVPEEHRSQFDELLAEARTMYRLRDERGVCSDLSSAGILRLALLELGRRLVREGRSSEAEHALYLAPDEATAAASGRGGPSAEELAARADAITRPTVVPPEAIGDAGKSSAPNPEALAAPLVRAVAAFRVLSAAWNAPGGVVDGILRGTGGHPGHYVGTARVVRTATDLLDVEPGDVIVAVTTSEAFNSAIFLAGAVVTDHGGLASHAAIVAREVGVPAVVGTGSATAVIASGDRVEVDGTEGTVTVLR